MVLQTGAQFVRFGQTSLTGDVVSLALVRELAPAITGLLTAGRCSSGMASELGSMLVTEQVDAMRAMGTDPSRKLVTPRVLASLAMVPLLTAMRSEEHTLNSSHTVNSYAVFCLKKKKKK